jgi:DNA-binding MltR family transcriptional regulator
MEDSELIELSKRMTENRYLKAGISPISPITDVDKLRFELNKETDRGCALLATAFLDNILKELLRVYLVDDEKCFHDLSSGTGGLSTFSSRIELSFLLGLISPMQRRDINLIKKIRNDFAHSMEIISFEDEAISNRVKELYHLYSGQDSKVRTRFIRVVFSIAGLIQGHIQVTERREKKENLDLTTPQIKRMIEEAEGRKEELMNMLLNEKLPNDGYILG